jgi:hypothetical protein
MGWLGLARDILRHEGRSALKLARRGGMLVAPGLTRRVARAASRHKRTLSKISKVFDQTINTADALASGDIAGGLHAGVHLGQTVQGLVKKNARKAMVPQSKKIRKLQTKPKRQGENASGAASLNQFDANVANDPVISGDLLARMTKSVRSRVGAVG